MSSRAISALALVILVLAVIGALSLGDRAGARREEPPLVVSEESEIIEDIVGVGQSVEVVGRVRGGVLALGGDVYVTGVVEGDVAAVGGSVRQIEGSRIGGDVVVVGGTYDHDGGREGRAEGSNTLIFAGDGTSLRDFFADPTRELLAPELTRAYVGRRLAAAFLSLLLALAIVGLAPRAVGRASERLATHPLRIAVIGLLGTIALLLLAGLALRLLPTPMAALVLVPLLVAVLATQVYGRVVAYFLIGRWLQRRALGERSRSQAVALALGVLVMAFAGSLPVVGAFVLFGMFILSTGVVLTARAGGAEV